MIEVPPGLAAYQERFRGDEGRAWVAGLPTLAAHYLDEWDLVLDGPPRHGMVALALPVRTAQGTLAVLKLQQVDEEHLGEGLALRTWTGDGAVRVLAEEPVALLLERLDADRPLSTRRSEGVTARVIAGLLARLHAHPAPPGIRPLAEVVAGMLDYAPTAAKSLTDVGERARLRDWGARVREISAEPGDRLLHWDLHDNNVLAAEREPWLAIDPKPLAGDPGFELLPALWNVDGETGDLPMTVRRRFDEMTEIMGLDRGRALAWTYARILQNCLWEVEDGASRLDPVQTAIAQALASAPRPL